MSDLASSNNGSKEPKLPSTSSKSSTLKQSSRYELSRQHSDSSNHTDSVFTKDGDDSSEAETVIMENAPSTTKKLKRLRRRRSSSDDNDFWADDIKKESTPSEHHESSKSHSSSKQELSRKSSDMHPSSRHLSKSSQGAKSRSPTSRSNSPGISISAGSKKASRSGRDANGRLKLQRMCDKGKYEEAKELIINGADVNDRDYAGNTAIHEAALKGHTRIVELLIDSGAIIDIRSGPGDLDTPLIDAAANDHLDVVRLLLKRGADPRIFNAQGKTSMDSVQADKSNHIQIEKLLRDASLRFRRKREADRQTPNGDGSDDPDSHHDFMDPANYVPGTFPPKVTDASSIQSMSSSAPRRRGARAQAIRNDLLWMDLTTRTGREQIYRKAADGDIEFVGNFLENGWKPDADCLALAARHGHTDVVGLLLAFGADSDGLNEDGETALQQTIGRGHFSTVKLLLDSGANPNVVNHAGKSCLDLAQDSLSSDDKEVSLIVAAMKSYRKSSRKPTDYERERHSRHERLERNDLSDRERKHERIEKKHDRHERDLAYDKQDKHDKHRKRIHDDDDSLGSLKKRKYLDGATGDKSDKETKLVRKEAMDVKVSRKIRSEVKTISDREDKPKGKLVSAIFKDISRESDEKRSKIPSIKERTRDTSEKLDKKKSRLDNDDRPVAREKKKSDVCEATVKQLVDGSPKRQLVEDATKKQASGEVVPKKEVSDVKTASEGALAKAAQDSEDPPAKSKSSTGEAAAISKPTGDESLSKPKRAMEESQSKPATPDEPLMKIKEVEPNRSEESPNSSSMPQSKELSPAPVKTKVDSVKRSREGSLAEPKIKRENSSDTLTSLAPVDDKEAQKQKEKDRESLKLREILIVKREKERKEREKKMLLQLEVEEKRKLEKRKRNEELEKQQKEREREESLMQKARDAAAEQERQRQYQARAEAEARKNYPYGLRMANYGTRTVEETLAYLPLFARRFRSGATITSTITSSDRMGCFVIDMQVALLLGVQNLYQACEYFPVTLF